MLIVNVINYAYISIKGYDEFNDILSTLVSKSFKHGDPMLDTTTLGPLAEPDELDKL
jgi:acyl-CoA reductase-like NAD-dependent aldehyde dehydrogenase